MNFTKAILIAISLLFITACGTVSHKVTQAEEGAYIVVKGDLSNKSFSINNAAPSPFPENDEDSIRIQVPIGNVNFKVFQSGKLIVNRKLFLSNNDNREINLP